MSFADRRHRFSQKVEILLDTEKKLDSSNSLVHNFNVIDVQIVVLNSILFMMPLVERGVRYVQLCHGPGQPGGNHNDIEKNHRRLAGRCDHGVDRMRAF